MVAPFINRIKKFFAEGDVRTKNLKGNIVYSALLKCISLVVTFLLVPATIGYVDSEIYGVWLTISAVLLWFQIMDIGIAPGLKNKLTEALASEDYERGRKLVSTTYAVTFLIFFPLSLFLFAAIPLISWADLLNVESSYEQSIVITLRLLSILICFQMVANVIVSVLAAYQRVAISQSFLVVGNILAYILILVLSQTVPPSLSLMALVLAGCPVLATIVGSILSYKRICGQVSPKLSFVDFSFTKELLSLGSKFFIINIQAVIVYQTTNILISHVSSPDMVTAYNIAYKYLSLTIFVYSNVTISLWTAYTDAYAKGDWPWMIDMRRKMNRLLIVCILLCVVFAVLSKSVYSLWIGDKADVPPMMTWWVAAYVSTYCFMTLNGTFTVGIGKVALETIVVSIGAVAYIPIALYVSGYMEEYGILATLVGINIVYGTIFYIQTNKLLAGTAQGIWNK